MRVPRRELAVMLMGVLAFPAEAQISALGRANAWLNTPPLRPADLRGKVVLVDFWTYTCINWRRTLPSLRAWAHKYKDQGLVVVGVHTPEFSFEKNLDNVRRATQEQDVDYPVALDSNYDIWNAFNNQYWPAVYLIDAKGQVRHQQFGEGDYDKLEVMIQKLLVEAGHAGFDRVLVSPDAHGAEVAADWKNLRTPETYLGSTRVASRRPLLTGDWTVRKESALLNKSNGKVVYTFHARDVHLVMGPAMRGKAVRFRVSIDGMPPGAAHGTDVDGAGVGTLDQPRMYQLIRQSGPIEERQFEIEFLDPGAEVFVFTFG